MKRIAILGSTGSIGLSTLAVAASHKDNVRVVSLAAGSNVQLLAKQARHHGALFAAIHDASKLDDLRQLLSGTGIEAGAGPDAVIRSACLPDVDLVVGAIVGGAGLLPLHEAAVAGKDLAIANKEPLVMAGELLLSAAKRNGSSILPIDSEHNAIFQCLKGEKRETVRRLLLTASGGPFRRSTRKEMEMKTVTEALAHPTWKMGPKITIDSATLMNKGLEVIEASFLFDMPADRIDVVIHPESVIHSLVEFQDGSWLAELGTADMRIPIRYALSYPERWPGEADLRLEPAALGSLSFHAPDKDRFPCLGLAYRALEAGAAHRIALNAANEVAVKAFLDGGIPFGAISRLVHATLDSVEEPPPDSIEAILDLDLRYRALATAGIKGQIPAGAAS